MNFKELTSREKRIIEEKGTEEPFSGEYENFYAEGTYACRRCGALLYRSTDKFDAHCGWPSFDDAVLGAVKRMPDADGRRTEIICRRCGAHLGHVFEGEELTAKNTRHCVNSLSLEFLSATQEAKGPREAYFAGGCFWCTEAAFKMVKGVKEVLSGYAGGRTPSPTYEEVNSQKTGHAETVKVTYDPREISFEGLLDIFFAMHDPTTPNRQGADVGSQYRSIIFYQDELQREIIEKYIAELEKEKVFAAPIVTEVIPFHAFYEAENHHQDYFAKNPEAAYCQAVINPKLAKLRKKLAAYLQ